MYELIQHQKLESGASTITFSNIPQIYTDLYLVFSLRGSTQNASYRVRSAFVSFNSSTSNRSSRVLYGYNSGVGSFSATDGFTGWHPDSAQTASTFGNSQLYIPNYTSSAAKSFSIESTAEGNTSSAEQNFMGIHAGLWNNTAAITSITITGEDSFVVGSSATLYGVGRKQALGKPKALGGNITYANGYWYHTFNSSSTLYTQQDLQADALVIAGGGGGGQQSGGGGGAGGFRSTGGIQLTKGAYSVIVGSGGTGATSNGVRGSNGSNSLFNSITASGGGGGASRNIAGGLAGGSGGGATNGSTNSGGAGNLGGFSPVEGFAGGNASGDSPPYGGAGGGGAGGVGSNNNAAGGNRTGGPGAYSFDGIIRAGGGGAAGDSGSVAVGGSGGGGNGGLDATSTPPTNGQVNTGSGGGGGNPVGATGGSGVVIVRYRA